VFLWNDPQARRQVKKTGPSGAGKSGFRRPTRLRKSR
jgi:hypothetical protein